MARLTLATTCTRSPGRITSVSTKSSFPTLVLPFPFLAILAFFKTIPEHCTMQENANDNELKTGRYA